ncbi:hypothetical protein B0T10DRAFT_321555 [Thelonectria olida]|uniref:Transmembrane protein n=1 Tax=Thelonectria olida TaxID=1576542 RepID=A0A9P8W7Z0_9HYPO|nr:hypothetical protein B0T10DRAFT_321555 [Thelonectria olida]
MGCIAAKKEKKGKVHLLSSLHTKRSDRLLHLSLPFSSHSARPSSPVVTRHKTREAEAEPLLVLVRVLIPFNLGTFLLFHSSSSFPPTRTTTPFSLPPLFFAFVFLVPLPHFAGPSHFHPPSQRVTKEEKRRDVPNHSSLPLILPFCPLTRLRRLLQHPQPSLNIDVEAEGPVTYS